MEWKIKITNNPNTIIKIKYLPISEKIEIFGEYKINARWNVFYTTETKSDVDLDKLKELIFDVYIETTKRTKKYKELSEVFAIIKEIETIEEDLDESYGIE